MTAFAGTPSGLDVSGQSSSPYDLALVMRQIVEDPELLAIMQTPTAVMSAVPPRYQAYQIQNQNPLLSTYPGMLAGKNGFTGAARYTYVGAAEQDGRRLVSLMLGEQTPIPMAEQAARLLDWGFALPAGTPAVGDLVPPRPSAYQPQHRRRPWRRHPRRWSRLPPGSKAREQTAPAPVLLVGLAVASAGIVVVLAHGRRRH